MGESRLSNSWLLIQIQRFIHSFDCILLCYSCCICLEVSTDRKIPIKLVSEPSNSMGPKKDLQAEVLEERMEVMQSDLRRDLDAMREEFQHLTRELDSMKTEISRLPAMEKKMDLLVVHLTQLLQATGKTGVGSSSGAMSGHL